jgi:hypothetical protein
MSPDADDRHHNPNYLYGPRQPAPRHTVERRTAKHCLSDAQRGPRVGLDSDEAMTTTSRVGPSASLAISCDAVLDRIVDLADAPPALAQRHADQADWDPRTARGRFTFVVLRPDRIQAWREATEIAGRTLMCPGSWVV